MSIDSESMKSWATLFGAVIAAATGVATFMFQWRDRRDRILVMEGGLVPSIDQYTNLYIANVGKHDVTIKDYGLILFKPSLLSIPYAIAEAEIPSSIPSLDCYAIRSTLLPPGGHVQAGVDLRGSAAGVYAITTTQAKPILRFFRSTGRLRRIYIRLRLFFHTVYG